MDITAKRINCILLFILCSRTYIIYAQAVQPITLDSIVSNFVNQVKTLPQEKVYIHTDKPYYLSGEKIYFRAHLADATYHMPINASRYVYVELLNPLDSVVVRLKIRPEKNMYYGQIILPDDLSEGTYRIRPYTQFMRNLDESYFFSKTVRIMNPNSLNLKLLTDFQFKANKNISLTIKFECPQNESFIPPQTLYLNLFGKDNKILNLDNDLYKISFDIPSDIKHRIISLETSYLGHTYKKFINIPYPDDIFQVNFFPEGGNLLDGAICNVGFKATKPDGSPENITGVIIDGQNNVMTDFESSYLGMGSFNFNPNADEKYQAICKNEDGKEIRFLLPDIKKSGYSIKVNRVQNKIWVSIPKTKNNIGYENLYLLMHSRGELLHAARWDSDEKAVFFEQNKFPSGVLHLILLNGDFQVISERLTFINNDSDIANVIFSSDKPEYNKRQQVKNTIFVNHQGQALTGNFSVSVTDDNEVMADTSANILSYLLLTSDLRGKIESPLAYFDPNDKKATFKLEQLMLTQGWRRYDVPEVLSGNISQPKFDIETGQKITGTVQGGLLLKKSEKAQVKILSLNKDYINITETDKNGKFVFEDFELPENTQLLVNAISKGGSDKMVLNIDKESFPDIVPYYYSEEKTNEKILTDYIQKEEKHYTYENGMRFIELDEIAVIAKRKPGSRSNYTSYAERSLTSDEIGNVAGLTTRKLIARLGGVNVSETGGISIRGKSPILLLVNDVETSLDFLDDIEADDVLRIDLIQSTLMLGTRGANGIISISTKSLEGIAAKKRFNMERISPLGYQKYATFYSPVYNTPEAINSETPDYRTTIFWKPDVQIDETGNASFDFYTSDMPSSYSVIIEGISSSGIPIYYKGKIINK